MRTWWRSQLPFFAFLLCFAAVALTLVVAGSAYQDSQEPAFVCDGDNCFADSRSWAERNVVLLSWAVASTVAAVAALIALRRRRA